MSEDKIGGEKAILEERRKKLENLRDKGVAYACLLYTSPSPRDCT